MQLLLRRTENGFMPLLDNDVKATSKIAIGNDILVDYKPRRNPKLHGKYWSFIGAVYDNIRHDDKERLGINSVDSLHESIKYRVGHYETFFSMTGEKLIKTKSTDFGSMDDALFSIFFEGAKDAGVELLDDSAVAKILTYL